MSPPSSDYVPPIILITVARQIQARETAASQPYIGSDPDMLRRRSFTVADVTVAEQRAQMPTCLAAPSLQL